MPPPNNDEELDAFMGEAAAGTTEAAEMDLADFEEGKKTVFLKDQNTVVEAPPETPDEELSSFIDSEIYAKQGGRLLGTFRAFATGGIAGAAAEVAQSEPVQKAGWNALKGGGAFFATLPGVAGSLIQEEGERMAEGPTMKQYFGGSVAALFDPNLKPIDRILLSRALDPVMGGVANAWLQHRVLRRELADNSNVDERLTSLGQEIQASNKAWVEKNGLKADPGYELFFDIGGAGATVLTSLGIGYATRNPALVGALFGTIQKGQLYADAREAGKSPEEAGNLSTLGGAFEGALEGLGLEIFMNTLRGSKTITRILLRSGEEAIQEGLQTTSEEIIAKLGWNREGTTADIAKRIGYSAMLGFIVGAPAATVATALENKGVIGELRRAGMNDKEAHEFMTIVTEKIQADAAEGVVNEVRLDVADQEEGQIEKIKDIGQVADEVSKSVSDGLAQGAEISVTIDGKQIQIVGLEKGMLKAADGKLYGVMAVARGTAKIKIDFPTQEEDIAPEEEDPLISEDEIGYINEFLQEDETAQDAEDAPAPDDATAEDFAAEDEASAANPDADIAPESIPESTQETLQRISETDDFQNKAQRIFELQGVIDRLAARREANERTKGIKVRRFHDNYLKEEMQSIPKKFITSDPSAMTLDELADQWGVDLGEAIKILTDSAITKQDVKTAALARKEIAEIEAEMSQKNPEIQKAVDAINAQGKSPSRIMVTQSGLLRRLFKERFKGQKIGFKEGREQGRQEVKSAKEILDRRRERIKAIAENFGLSDAELKQITKKDIRLMNNFEFKKFIDDIEARAATLAEKREIKNQILFEIQDKELTKTENLRVYLKFPSLDQMSVEQLNEFNQILQDARHGDEFLSVRKLETVKNTDLAGMKTVREAKELLAKKMGVPVEALNNVTAGPLDKFLFDTVLAKKNPFYQFLVDETNASLIEGEQRYFEMEREVDDLTRKARKSRPMGIVDRMIPTDELVFQWLEAKPEAKVKLAEQMTPAEIDLANYLQARFAQFRDYLVEHEVLKKYKSDYITHIRKGFLETWKDDGLIAAFKEAFNAYKEDEAIFKILDDDTQNILPLEKFFQFSMKRSGDMKPSQNVAKAFKAYTQAMIKKQSLDKIVPALDIYAYTLSPKQKTPRGLEMNRQLVKFVREWVNNKKGRRSSLGGILPQNGGVDMGIRAINAFVTVIDLGLNIPVGIAANVGEQVVTFVNLGSKKYATGIARMNTAKGKKILADHEGLIGKSPWKNLSDTASDIGAKFHSGLFLLFQTSTVRANKIHLLGSMSAAEWEAGKVSADRQAEIRREIGRFRAVEGAKSIFGSTSAGGVLTKYKTWALPVLSTVIDDIGILNSMIAKGKADQVVKTREFQELFRATVLTTLFVTAFKGMIPDDDKSFVGQVIKKAYRESMTILGALDPTVLSSVRMASFLADLAASVKMIVMLEKYKRKKGYKGVAKLQQTLTPRAIKNLAKKKKKGS